MGPTTTIQALVMAACGATVVAVTKQGTLGAAVAGMVVAAAAILGLGPGALAPLAMFVLGGGFLTKWGRARKRDMAAAEPNEGKRGAQHVAAKLAIPAVVAVVAGVTGLAGALSVAFVAGLAGALADTAGTEVGPLGGGAAYVLRQGKVVPLPHGSPGAVSAAGLTATAAGSVAVVAAAVATGLIHGIGTATMAATAGLGAALFESFIANSPLGRGLGHFGRNVFVSGIATAFGLAAGFSLGGS
jgi:uncharacterized membrane protein